MTSQWSRTVVVALIAVSLVAWSGAIVLAAGRTSVPFGPVDVLWALSFLAIQGVGAIVLWRRPDNVAAWYFLTGPPLIAVGVLGSDYAGAVLEGRVSLPGPAWAALAGSATFVLGVGLLALTLYRFPDGRAVGPVWRVLERGVMGGLVATVLVALAEPDVVTEPLTLANPLTRGHTPPGVGVLEAILLVTQPLLVGGVGSLVSLVVRWRRGDATTRRQLTWVIYPVVVGTVLTVMLVLVDLAAELSESTQAVLGVAVTVVFTVGVPVGILMAMTRARLYDVDRLVSRTVSYGVLSAVLGGVYLGLVLGLRGVLGAGLGTESDLVVAASTLVVAALFGPLRRRVQATVDRRFDRPRLDRRRTLDAFSARLRDEVDRDAVVGDLRATVNRTFGPDAAWVWQPPR